VGLEDKGAVEVFAQAAGDVALAELDLFEGLLGRGDLEEEGRLVLGAPGLEALVTRLTGERVSLPTAALVECTVDVVTWSDVTEQTSAELTAISYPRED